MTAHGENYLQKLAYESLCNDQAFYRCISDDLQLKMLFSEHAPELLELIDKNRSHLRQWLPWVDKTVAIKDVHEFILSVNMQFCRLEGFACAIFFKNKIVGVIGFHQLDKENRIIKIGYWLDEDATGKGIVTQSCQAMLRHAFEELNINRIAIHAATQNTASRAIPERLGFQLEGIKRDAEWLGSSYVDHAVYSMLKVDWHKLLKANSPAD
jgi:ribosomal-protein-serine acetyltransferase